MSTYQSSTVFVGGDPSRRSQKRRGMSAIRTKLQRPALMGGFNKIIYKLLSIVDLIRSIGVSSILNERDKRKLEIFNLLNFLSLLTGVVAPIAGLIGNSRIPAFTWLAVFTPALVNVAVLLLNYYRKYDTGMIAYFILYPVVTSFVYLNGLNPGMDLYFILCGVLSVFFIRDIGHMFFSIALSMISYFLLSVLFKNYHYRLESANFGVYVFNQALAIIFIFYGLFLIKRENSEYQAQLLGKNEMLIQNNSEIQEQQEEIEEKATMLEDQKLELENANLLKTKLFSIISHDLKGPMYALRNLFQEMQQNDIPAEEIKEMLPEVITDLNNTTGLMENVLQWAKAQMHGTSVSPQNFDLNQVVQEVLRPLRLSASLKRITIEHSVAADSIVFADKDMIALVLRNLIANAIKFTRSGGVIKVDARLSGKYLKVFVKDNGIGITAEQQKKLFNEFYSKTGTANETGTGLGLILCKEFVEKNGGHIDVTSKDNEGTAFSFTIPS